MLRSTITPAKRRTAVSIDISLSFRGFFKLVDPQHLQSQAFVERFGRSLPQLADEVLLEPCLGDVHPLARGRPVHVPRRDLRLGAGHLLLLWEGDILLLYALIGFILPLFRKLSNRHLLILAAVLIFSPLLFDLFSVLFQYKNGSILEKLAISIDQKNGIPADENFAYYLYKDGAGWNEWRNWQESGYLYRYAYILDSNRIPKVLGMFLIGLYAGRKMIYAHLADNISLFKRLRKWGLLIGIPSAIACFYFEFFQKHIPSPIGMVHTLFYATSVVPLCLAYVSMICLRWERKKGMTRFRFLAPMGRMALTNYLMQTIIGICIYYGVGLGFGSRVGPSVFAISNDLIF